MVPKGDGAMTALDKITLEATVKDILVDNCYNVEDLSMEDISDITKEIMKVLEPVIAVK